ncbi:MAG: hypothetical protein ABIH34_06625 [Nanoarchaeota archaeon]
MPTVSHIVKKYVADKPFLHEAMSRGIVSYGNLAEDIHAEVEKEMGKKVMHGAVVMALRRHAEEIVSSQKKSSFNFSSEIVMKTQVCAVAFQKTTSLLKSLEKLTTSIDIARGDILYAIYGSEEVSIVTNEKHLGMLKKMLDHEEMINEERNLVSLSLRFNEKFLHTPNVIFRVLRELAWENVNIIEIVSTFTELTLILNHAHAMKAYESLQRLVNSKF